MEAEQQFISATGVSAEQSEMRILVRQGGIKASTKIERTQSTAAENPNGKWRLSDVSLSPPSIIQKPPILTQALHPAISDFTQTLAEIDGVRCIVVEDTEGQIIHFSTFAFPVTESLRTAVYAAEASLIDRYPGQVFDFHLRSAAETHGGRPVPIPGQHFFAIWGNLDEESGRASEAGEKQ